MRVTWLFPEYFACRQSTEGLLHCQEGGYLIHDLVSTHCFVLVKHRFVFFASHLYFRSELIIFITEKYKR